MFRSIVTKTALPVHPKAFRAVAAVGISSVRYLSRAVHRTGIGRGQTTHFPKDEHTILYNGATEMTGNVWTKDAIRRIWVYVYIYR